MSTKNVLAMDRGAIYEILASQYLVLPNKENISELQESFKLAEEIFTEISFEDFRDELNNRYNRIEHIEDLEQEYYDHFVVPVSKNFIPVRESHLEDARRILKGEKIKNNRTGWKFGTDGTELVYNLNLAYDSVGFKVEEIQISKDLYFLNKIDYIGYELAFMAYLAFSEEGADEENKPKWRKLQKDFLESHLVKFMEKYNEISMDRSNKYYSTLSKLVLDFVKWDLSFE